jgi:hypothetical protein
MIDYEGQMAFAVESTPIDILRNNTGMVAASATTFEVPMDCYYCRRKKL